MRDPFARSAVLDERPVPLMYSGFGASASPYEKTGYSGLRFDDMLHYDESTDTVSIPAFQQAPSFITNTGIQPIRDFEISLFGPLIGDRLPENLRSVLADVLFYLTTEGIEENQQEHE